MYSYLCPLDHEFVELRPMSEVDAPIACPAPGCGQPGKHTITLGNLGMRAVDTKTFRGQVRQRSRDILTGEWSKLPSTGLRGAPLEVPSSRPESESKTTVSPLDPYRKQR